MYLPFVSDSLLMIVLGYICWQNIQHLPEYRGGRFWLFGSISMGLGLAIEVGVFQQISPRDSASIGFTLLSLGMGLCCIGLLRFKFAKPHLHLTIICLLSPFVSLITSWTLSEYQLFPIRSVIMSLHFFLYLLVLFIVGGRGAFSKMWLYFTLFATAFILFLLRVLIFFFITPHSEIEPAISIYVDYYIGNIASVAIVSSSVAYLMLVFIEHTHSLETDASKDPLTGCYNRRSLDVILSTLGDRNSCYSVVMLDIDHFKLVNDTYGHKAGDMVLRRFADYLRENLRDGDILARYGGEEFCLILKEVLSKQAATIVDRLREGFSKCNFETEGDEFFCTFSSGVSDSSVTESDDLIRLADKALYSAKFHGRNRVVVAGSL